jgi:predicted DNA-binding WGR domain protein
MSRYFLTCTEGGSDKFYEIQQTGTSVTTRYGKTGADGVSATKSYASVAEAIKFVEKTLNEKLKKGYSEASTGSKKREIEAPSGSKKKTRVTREEEVDEEEEESQDETAFSKTYLTFEEGNSSKFYEIILEGTTVHTRYGKIDTDGISASKSFKSSKEALKFAEKTKSEKINKGYEEDDGNDGSDVDLSGTILDLPEPSYSKDFLQKVCKKGQQFIELCAAGDWEAYLLDLEVVLPHLVNVKTIFFQINQCGCRGVDTIIDMLQNLRHLETLDLSSSIEDDDDLNSLIALVSKHTGLKVLKMNLEECFFEDRLNESYEKVVAAIYTAITSGVSQLTEVELGKDLKDFLETMHLDDSFATSSNIEILKHLHSISSSRPILK